MDFGLDATSNPKPINNGWSSPSTLYFLDVRFIFLTMVRWEKPIAKRFKLNSDGCSKENPGRSGGMSILRNSEGKLYGFNTSSKFLWGPI